MENFEFDMAKGFVNETNTSIFLTGKAGTGKTTFLKEVVKASPKKCIIVAPTGVAAINAGGVTIHSMFGLPTKSFVPSNDVVDPNLANNQGMISLHFHYQKDKLEVLQELELLVIDEVSMVRADLLDAVDFALRFVRRNQKPFGGVQVLFIGDMYQLPPVVKDHEWPLLSKYYSSPYFFDSLSFKSIEPVYIELKKIYRQSDRNFINILNNIRNQDFQSEDYEALKAHYNPDFQPKEPGFITLTTHNRKADAINEKELANLEGEEVGFDALLTGDFFENMFPTERLLRLKKGAQVMFVKNDTSGEKRYFNGKIGIVESIDAYDDDDKVISVRFPDTNELIYVARELWENIRYSVNGEDNKLEQNTVGSFSQYPLRLAWAITIHKSQGLTFEKAVIDAGESFSPGQVYVALSRCTGMENMILHSIITNRNIFSDERIVAFSNRIMKEMVLENYLELGKKTFALDQLIKVFNFVKLRNQVGKWEKSVLKIKTVDKLENLRWAAIFEKTLDKLQGIAEKFHLQLRAIYNVDNNADKNEQLKSRVNSAIDFFSNTLYDEIIKSWDIVVADYRYKSKMKKYYAHCQDLSLEFWRKVDEMYNCSLGQEKLYTGIREIYPEKTDKKTANKKIATGDTYSDTLELYKAGKSATEIATERGMAVSTIEGHLAQWINKGEINVEDLMEKDRIETIVQAIKQNADGNFGKLKAILGNDYTYAEIRYVTNSVRRKVPQTVK